VILDVMMPRKNGYVSANEIKKSTPVQGYRRGPAHGGGRCRAHTSYTHMDGKNTLADDFIPKPIDLDKLMEIVVGFRAGRFAGPCRGLLPFGPECGDRLQPAG
jgi:two-component system, OmpR family, alkaline phosphatase synthesis response regulator PhoP